MRNGQLEKPFYGACMRCKRANGLVLLAFFSHVIFWKMRVEDFWPIQGSARLLRQGLQRVSAVASMRCHRRRPVMECHSIALRR